MSATTKSSKLDRYKLETTLCDDYVIHTTYQTDLTAKQRRVMVETKWTEKKECGSGGFGVVSLQETQKGQLRAVKRLPKGPGRSYSRELEILSKVIDRSDLFVLFLGWYENMYCVFIAMEYIEHGDLGQYLETPDIKPNARAITIQLAEGLSVLHERGICHRDLKPQNILIASLNPIWVKLADFGGSKREKGTYLHTELGTQGYLAPEILKLLPKQQNSYTNAVDIWALGCVVHKMLTLQTPFLEIMNLSNTDISGLQSEIEFTDPGYLDIKILLRFCQGEIEFPVDLLEQSHATYNEISFVKSLLVANPESRISATGALQSPWLLESNTCSEIDKIEPQDFSNRNLEGENFNMVTREPDILETIDSVTQFISPEVCLEYIKSFIDVEKRGLTVFYDETALIKKAEEASFMTKKLMADGCGKEIARDLALLTLYDIVILIDDSSSMQTEEVVGGKPQRVETLKTTLEEIANIYELANPKGVQSVRFLNTVKGKRNVTSEKAKILLNDHIYRGVTRIGTELQKKILKRFVWNSTYPMTKPLLVMVITDGEVEGERVGLLQDVIINCLNKLKVDDRLEQDAVAFHFSRVGNDEGAAKLLERLGSHKELMQNVQCLPVTKPLERISDESLKWTVLPKLLLGGIIKHWGGQDVEGPDFGLE